MKQIHSFVVWLLGSLPLVVAAHGRIIMSIEPSRGPGLGGIVVIQISTPVLTPFPNNDNTIAASGNTSRFPGVPYPKRLQVMAPIDTPLTVSLSGGTTEYYFTEEAVNLSSEPWTAFRFELGTGTGVGYESLRTQPWPFNVRLPEFDSPGFDPEPQSSVFTKVLKERDSLTWTDGVVPPGGSVSFSFSLDTPDDWLGTDIYRKFTIREVSIPEAQVGVVLGLPVLLWAVSRRRVPAR